LIDLDSVRAAAGRLAGHIVNTPLLESPLLNDRMGRRILVKPECLQRTGSFKFRGAFNRLSQFSDAERRRGVIAYSSGNHAQGIAYAARILGIPATIVMPADAPRSKIGSTRAYGATVVQYDRVRESREEITADIASRQGQTIVPPFEDVHIMAGQGTVGLEIAQQCAAANVAPSAVVVNCGGGGLTAGTAVALSALMPDTAIYTAEPAGFDDTRQSLAAGERRPNPPGGYSFCDALLTPMPGEMTFSVLRTRVSGGLSASDPEVEVAMATASSYLKITAEPGGAVSLAATLAGRVPGTGPVVAIVSGGNVDIELFSDILRRTPPV
jgi:threonine dehydratase